MHVDKRLGTTFDDDRVEVKLLWRDQISPYLRALLVLNERSQHRTSRVSSVFLLS